MSGKLYADAYCVSGNLGPGIAAAGDISLGILSATGNQGPGVQSIFGSITIEPVNDESASPDPELFPYIKVTETKGQACLPAPAPISPQKATRIQTKIRHLRTSPSRGISSHAGTVLGVSYPLATETSS